MTEPTVYKDISVRSEAAGPPSVIEPSLAEWQKCPEGCRESARIRLSLVNKARSIKARAKGEKTEALKRYAKSQGVSYATLCRYIGSADRALKDAQAAGSDAVMAQVMALTPGYGNRQGAFRAFDRKAVDFAIKLYSTQAHPNLSDVYDRVINEAAIRTWKVGSYDTLKRIIDQELTDSLKTLTRKGPRRYQADCELKILRDYREIWPNFMWCGDHHIFDVFVRAPGGKVIRPWLTMWMDMASRSFMGWCISFQPNSRTIALALAHAISKKDDAAFPQHGLPWSVYIDNGKDYRCRYLNGESIEIGTIDYPEIIERFAGLGIDPFYIDLEYDPGQQSWVKRRGNLSHTVKNIRVGGVYARLNIHQRYATAYHPWAKPIERAFRNVVQQFSRELPGWCGSGHEQRPEKLVFELKRGLILDFYDFCGLFYDWVVHKYHKTPHTGHGMDGRSPDEVFLAFGAPETVEPELLTFALLKKEDVMIHNWGFVLFGREFELDVPGNLAGAAILNTAINRRATILHDPDCKIVRVYVNGRYLCNGRRLRRASFMRADDPVMIEKLKLQAYQRQLNRQGLAEIQAAALPEVQSEADAILQLTAAGAEESPPNADDEPRAPGIEESDKGSKNDEPLPLNDEERFRMILRREASGDELSEADRLWRDEYAATDEYLSRKQLYDAELEYLKFKKECVR